MAVIQIKKPDGTTVYVGDTDECEHCLLPIRRHGDSDVFTGPDGLIECPPRLVGWQDREHEPIGCIFPPE